MRNRPTYAFAAVALAWLGFESAANAQGSCTGNGRISKQIAIPMKAAQDALNAKRWPAALAKTKEVEAIPGKSGFDQYKLHEFQGYAYSHMEKYAETARELEAGLNSGCMPEADKPSRYEVLAKTYYQVKNYAKVIEYGTRALNAGADPRLAQFVGQAYYLTNDNKNAMRVMNDVVSDQERRGKTPSEQTLLLLQSACARLGDIACVGRQYERLVVNYPKAEYWQNLVHALQKSVSNDQQLLSIMRLAVFVDAMKQPDQFTEMAQLALERGLPGEAQTVLQQGFTKGVFKDARTQDRNARLLNSAIKQAVPDKASLDKQAAAARASPTGEADVKLGAAYLSYGEPAKAVDAISRGIAKGGVKESDEAALLLGAAHLRNGNKPQAARAFRTVTKDPTMARIAKLWLLNT
jgi:tetratricopeptide (TPR) repeat protein